MRRFLALTIFFSLSFGVSAQDIAFGFFKNHSKRKNLDRLQLFIPLSVANELKGVSSHSILNPLETQAKLKDKGLSLKVNYPDEELEEISKKLGVDAFVYGGYSVNRRQYVINAKIYLRNRKQVLSLQTEGVLGQSITSTIKAIRTYFYSFLGSSPKFISEKITKKERVCFLTNLENHQINSLVITFMKKGYSVCAIGLTDFNYFSANETIPFYSMVGQGTGFDSLFKKPKDFEKFELTIASTKNKERIVTADKDLQLQIDYGIYYPQKKKEALQNFREKFQADYLIVFNQGGQKADKDLGFNVKNKESFARAINLKSGQLVYVQENFKAGFFKSNSLENQAEVLLSEIQSAPEIKKESLRRGQPKAPTKGQETPDEEKALVGILNFYDRTNTNSYTWMSTSLADSINKSMLQVFEFNRADPSETQTKVDAILKGSDKVNKEILKALQKATALDYIVLGKYTYDTSSKKITVTAAVYDLYTFDKIGEALAKTETDVRLFSSVDVVAQKIVKDIFKFAANQGGGGDDKKAPARQFIVIKKGIIRGDAATKSIDEQANLIEFERYNIDWLDPEKKK